MIPKSVIDAAAETLSRHLDVSLRIEAHRELSGGSINKAIHLQTSAGDYFLKWNDAEFSDNFAAECKGLQHLRASGTLHIPEVIGSADAPLHAILLMEYIEKGKRAKNYWEHFGTQLAALHRHTQAEFGLDYDNYIGSLPQSNTKHAVWTEFFILERLEAQLRLATGNSYTDRKLRKSFDKLCAKLESYFPVEPPALLHGDLWSGNVIIDKDGCATLFDPAIYYGHREAEIAFTRLFGGFAEEFYQAYEQAFPLESSWRDRVDLYNLYPLLVHLNLFGLSYRADIEHILNRFT